MGTYLSLCVIVAIGCRYFRTGAELADALRHVYYSCACRYYLAEALMWGGAGRTHKLGEVEAMVKEVSLFSQQAHWAQWANACLEIFGRNAHFHHVVDPAVHVIYELLAL